MEPWKSRFGFPSQRGTPSLPKAINAGNHCGYLASYGALSLSLAAATFSFIQDLKALSAFLAFLKNPETSVPAAGFMLLTERKSQLTVLV